MKRTFKILSACGSGIATSSHVATSIRQGMADRGLAVEVRKRHIKRLRKGKCTIELGFLLSDIVTAYERIAAHCVHIAVRMVQVQEDSLEMHGYSEELKEKDRERIHLLYEGLVQEFLLP